MGWRWPAQCSLVVSAEGYEDEVFAMKDLCPAGQNDCSWVAFQAELVPKAGAGPTPTEAAATRAAPLSIHFTSDRRDLSVVAVVGEAGGWRAWESGCRPPCDARLSPDAKIAIALGDRGPVPLSVLNLAPDACIDVRYDDRRTLGKVAAWVGLIGIVSGITMAAVGGPGDQPWRTQNVVLESAGWGLLLDGLGLLVGPGSALDRAYVEP